MTISAMMPLSKVSKGSTIDYDMISGPAEGYGLAGPGPTQYLVEIGQNILSGQHNILEDKGPVLFADVEHT